VGWEGRGLEGAGDGVGGGRLGPGARHGQGSDSQ
jgi:hypothetical protein